VLPAPLAEQFAELMADATLLNIYESSEVAADATWHEIRPAGIAWREVIGIGLNSPVSASSSARLPMAAPTGCTEQAIWGAIWPTAPLNIWAARIIR
jgi:hypothetical protein